MAAASPAPTGDLPDGVRRVALGIEYNGSRYRGWQVQRDPEVPTIQSALETGLAKIAGHAVATRCAGRTDTGVHATGQVVHFDTTVARPEKAWVFGTNTRLPADICVRWAREVRGDFHARFAAVARRYRYIIFNDAVRPAVHPYQMTWQCLPLDAGLMHREAQILRGSHDFSSFRAAGCQSRSAVREVLGIGVSRRGQLVILDICANAFLMHMVRNIAGVLMAVGSGRAAPGWTAQVLAACDRRAGGVTAPAHGLYLVEVRYPDRFALPAPAPGPWLLGE